MNYLDWNFLLFLYPLSLLETLLRIEFTHRWSIPLWKIVNSCLKRESFYNVCLHTVFTYSTVVSCKVKAVHFKSAEMCLGKLHPEKTWLQVSETKQENLITIDFTVICSSKSSATPLWNKHMTSEPHLINAVQNILFNYKCNKWPSP